MCRSQYQAYREKLHKKGTWRDMESRVKPTLKTVCPNINHRLDTWAMLFRFFAKDLLRALDMESYDVIWCRTDDTSQLNDTERLDSQTGKAIQECFKDTMSGYPTLKHRTDVFVGWKRAWLSDNSTIKAKETRDALVQYKNLLLGGDLQDKWFRVGDSTYVPLDKESHVQQILRDNSDPHNTGGNFLSKVFMMTDKEEANVRRMSKVLPGLKYIRVLNSAVTGLVWRNAGDEKPSKGEQFHSDSLAAALEQKTEFTQAEWDTFHITGLLADHFIKSGASYFQPAAVDDASTTKLNMPPDYVDTFSSLSHAFPYIKMMLTACTNVRWFCEEKIDMDEMHWNEPQFDVYQLHGRVEANPLCTKLRRLIHLRQRGTCTAPPLHGTAAFDTCAFVARVWCTDAVRLRMWEEAESYIDGDEGGIPSLAVRKKLSTDIFHANAATGALAPSPEEVPRRRLSTHARFCGRAHATPPRIR
jgi:hypothetical protein